MGCWRMADRLLSVLLPKPSENEESGSKSKGGINKHNEAVTFITVEAKTTQDQRKKEKGHRKKIQGNTAFDSKLIH